MRPDCRRLLTDALRLRLPAAPILSYPIHVGCLQTPTPTQTQTPTPTTAPFLSPVAPPGAGPCTLGHGPPFAPPRPRPGGRGGLAAAPGTQQRRERGPRRRAAMLFDASAATTPGQTVQNVLRRQPCSRAPRASRTPCSLPPPHTHPPRPPVAPTHLDDDDCLLHHVADLGLDQPQQHRNAPLSGLVQGHRAAPNGAHGPEGRGGAGGERVESWVERSSRSGMGCWWAHQPCRTASTREGRTCGCIHNGHWRAHVRCTDTFGCHAFGFPAPLPPLPRHPQPTSTPTPRPPSPHLRTKSTSTSCAYSLSSSSTWRRGGGAAAAAAETASMTKEKGRVEGSPDVHEEP